MNASEVREGVECLPGVETGVARARRLSPFEQGPERASFPEIPAVEAKPAKQRESFSNGGQENSAGK